MGTGVHPAAAAVTAGAPMMATATNPYTGKRYTLPAWARDQAKAERHHDYYNRDRHIADKSRHRPAYRVFVWRNPDPNGEPQKVCLPYLPGATKPGLDSTPRVLFNLPAIIEAERSRLLFITAGEKDAEALIARGELATTCLGGERAWLSEFGYQYDLNRFQRICIIPDRDGEEPAATVAQQYPQRIMDTLTGPQVRMLELPDLSGSKDDKDLSDWFAKGHTIEELRKLAYPLFKEPDQSPLEVVTVADVESEPVTWLWHNRIPKNKLTLLWGDPDTNKSWLTLDLAARITRGDTLPDNGASCEIGTVLILTSEDGIADTIRPRLELLQADLNRVDVLRSVKDRGKRRSVSLQTDLDLIELQLRERRYKLLIIDPIDAYLGSGKDSFKYADMRAVLDPLADFAQRNRITLLAIQHLTKQTRDKAIYKGQGNVAFLATARSVLFVGTDPNDNERRRRVIHCLKHNLAADRIVGLAFQVRDGQLNWLGETDVTVAQLLDAELTGKEESELQEAIDYLTQLLDGGSVRASGLFEVAEEEHGISQATLRRAKHQLKIASVKGTGKFASKWYWVWPGAIPVMEDDPY